MRPAVRLRLNSVLFMLKSPMCDEYDLGLGQTGCLIELLSNYFGYGLLQLFLTLVNFLLQLTFYFCSLLRFLLYCVICP